MFVVRINGVKESGYLGSVYASFGEDYPDAHIGGSRGFTIPTKRMPTVVRNKLNENMCFMFSWSEHTIEDMTENPDLIPVETAVYFEMIWKSH